MDESHVEFAEGPRLSGADDLIDRPPVGVDDGPARRRVCALHLYVLDLHGKRVFDREGDLHHVPEGPSGPREVGDRDVALRIGIHPSGLALLLLVVGGLLLVALAVGVQRLELPIELEVLVVLRGGDASYLFLDRQVSNIIIIYFN